MKKFHLKLIGINIVVLFILLVVIDVFSAYKDYNFMCNYIKEVKASTGFNQEDNDLPKFEYRLGLISYKKFWKQEAKNFETDINRNIGHTDDDKNKESILIFGDSFAKGTNPDYKGNLNYVLNKYTDDVVYNRAFNGFGPAPMLWQVRNQEFYDGIKISPNYIIYVFVTYQPERILNDKWGNSSSRPIYIGYNEKDDELVENKSPLLLLCNFNFIKKFVIEHYKKIINGDNKYLFDLFKLHLLESKKELQKKYPNAKFIIVKYPMVQDSVQEEKKFFYETEQWSDFEKEGFIIYDLKKEISVDLTDKKYLLPDLHPNKEAWELVVPKLVKDLNL